MQGDIGVLEEIATSDAISRGRLCDGITGAVSAPRRGRKMNFLQGAVGLENFGDKPLVASFGYFRLR
jgi:hypothetical protein